MKVAILKMIIQAKTLGNKIVEVLKVAEEEIIAAGVLKLNTMIR